MYTHTLTNTVPTDKLFFIQIIKTIENKALNIKKYKL